MARLALKLKSSAARTKLAAARAAGTKMPLATRVYNRCELCGRRHGFMRRFNICRICFRELARRGMVTGVTLSSW